MSTHPRATALIAELGLTAHPEGGWYREVFRSEKQVGTNDDRQQRRALTTIDFLLSELDFSAWHRVRSDEVWHLLEGGPLRLWLCPPGLGTIQRVDLATVSEGRAPRLVVPAGWWQAAAPLAPFAYCGATVGPGFDFADFSFGRDDADLVAALTSLDPQALRLL